MAILDECSHFFHLRLSVSRRPGCRPSGRAGGVRKAKSEKNDCTHLELPSLTITVTSNTHDIMLAVSAPGSVGGRMKPKAGNLGSRSRRGQILRLAGKRKCAPLGFGTATASRVGTGEVEFLPPVY